MGYIEAWWRWMRDRPHTLLAFLGACLICGALQTGFDTGVLPVIQFDTGERFPAGLDSALASPSVAQVGARMIGDTATLGGTERGFTAVYGAPAQSSGTEATYIIQTRASQLFITIDSDVAKDGTSHIYDIYLTIQFSSGAWHQDAADRLYSSFLPSDATHLKDVRQGDSPERIFLSANLAATFPASSFVEDDNQKILPPGTFDAYCAPLTAGSGSCTIALGALGGA